MILQYDQGTTSEPFHIGFEKMALKYIIKMLNVSSDDEYVVTYFPVKMASGTKGSSMNLLDGK